MSRSAQVSKGKANMAYALRAQMAIDSNDYASAVGLAESAVEASPQDANVRGLLGNAYFGAGRFASAEAAYGDSLSLAAMQPSVILKRALVQIAQGKNDEAISLLQQSQSIVDPADYGLALALAGRSADAVQILDVAARANGADARVRQNLALALGLSGDWNNARIVASQDLPADQVDARVQQWMSLAKPAHAYDQVAALTGVTPSVVGDPGQPVRLALNGSSNTRVAQAAAAPAPVQVAEAAPVPNAPYYSTPVSQPDELAPAPAPAPVVEQREAIAVAAAVSPEAPAAFAMMSSNFAPKAKPAKAKKAAAPARPALASASGKSKAVVQIGAYSSEARVSAAWAQLSKKYPGLRKYSPMVARFDGPKGTVWRLSIRGFGSQSEAASSCSALRGKGGTCFVRGVAGDSPVQFASR
ncbi:hypothetical protein GCM10023264_00240 [Sphingomonas daechungensis]|uniref:Tetratricopeptide repeat protein n=2 Tax=Sphingomonas daechungensis TaxID=1176646 RepID=A0ABX6SY82_9SPHN|nr:SPOR domain-containing protein [Sphingomonas daechungensis]QNP42547.1 tetratricopeptide repeat protein [Sphingomonas daechungensis]